MHKEDLAYIEHMLFCIKKIQKFRRGLDKKSFSGNVMAQDAIIRNIEIIGEASKKISDGLKKEFPGIPWREISGMRDKLIHDYLGVDIDVIWITIEKDIPQLRKGLKSIQSA